MHSLTFGADGLLFGMEYQWVFLTLCIMFLLAVIFLAIVRGIIILLVGKKSAGQNNCPMFDSVKEQLEELLDEIEDIKTYEEGKDLAERFTELENSMDNFAIACGATVLLVEHGRKEALLAAENARLRAGNGKGRSKLLKVTERIHYMPRNAGGPMPYAPPAPVSNQQTK